MMFSSEDLKVRDMKELLEFLPILIFVALVFPFIFAAYKVGFVMDVSGWLQSKDKSI